MPVRAGFTGPVYPVNRGADVVMSMPAYASVEVPAVVEDCGNMVAGGLVVITAGFREIGPEKAAREDAAIAITQRYAAPCWRSASRRAWRSSAS